MKRGRGFTLLETSVVMLLIAVLAVVALPLLRPDAREVLRDESARLAQLLALAAQEARLTGAPIVWTGGAGHYAFLRWRDERWTAVDARDVLRPRTLPAGVTVRAVWVEGEGVQQTQAARIAFAPNGIARAFRVELRSGEQAIEVIASAIGTMHVEERATVADATRFAR